MGSAHIWFEISRPSASLMEAVLRWALTACVMLKAVKRPV
jgi:hypothetical protein